MCGIFGWSFKRKSRVQSARREVVASTLAVRNSDRGDKSWGMLYKTKKGTFIRREVGDICDFPDFSCYGRINMVMAHTRQPTMGKVTKKNAHPFVAGKIVLAHNGTISNVSKLNEKYKRDVEVDSEHLALHLDAGLPFDDIEGYGAIEWVHSDFPNRIYLCRMRRGDLHVAGIGERKDPMGIIWSSDKDHVDLALRAAGMISASFDYAALDEGTIFFAENGELYTAKEEKKLSLAEPDYRTGYSYVCGQGDWAYERTGKRVGGYRVYKNPELDGYWVSREKNMWMWLDAKPNAYDHDREDDEMRMYMGGGGD